MLSAPDRGQAKQDTAFAVLAAISFSHLLNDTIQSVLPAIYPLLKSSFALTFAAVMLRIYIPVALVTGIGFEAAYPAIAWLCWVPNLLVAQLLVRSARGV